MKGSDLPSARHPERSAEGAQSKDPSTTDRLRVATYNIHKCRGLDRRTSPARIISILQQLDADILCLQEVVNAPGAALRTGGPSLYDQAGEIERALPAHTAVFGANRPLHGGTYGNLTLSRLPIRSWHNHDITSRREARGVLQTDIQLGPHLIHLFNIHLGTSFPERRRQARLLLGDRILANPALTGPRLILGDLNEWTQGLTTQLLRNSFRTFRPRHSLQLPATFPGLLPLLTLDHCYFEPPLELVETHLFRSRTALIASDHLPLIADFTLS
ncbi:MAG TPA: endonuclease/exonuclease/phosphatase family protein [Candidatus Aquilonibacter sp.]|nr:endonuclease/exonuclease/phosphatase family protein [Candidatus Aquilonibacter sp.]